MIRALFSALLLGTLAAAGADHVYFPETRIARVAPEKLHDQDLSKAFRKTAGERTDISLNGFWRFTLCEKEQETPPPLSEEWGYFLVPGFWRMGAMCNFFRTSDGRAVEKVRGKSYNDYRQGWYFREFATPPESAGRQTLLKFDALYTKGIVVVNGQRVPLPEHQPRLNCNTPAFQVDITRYLRPEGEKNTIYVATSPEDLPGDAARAGLQDNVWLCTRPLRNFGNPRVFSFVKARKLRIDFHGGTLPESFDGTLEFTFRDAATGETVHTERRPFAPTVTLDYVTPKLWSVDEPNLYYLDCRLTPNGAGIVDAATLRFGFRELTAENGRFLLNGKPVMVNTDSSWQGMWAPLWHTMENMTRKSIRLMKLFGINAAYTQRMNAASFYDIADEEGFLCIERIELTYDEYNTHTAEECLALWRSLAREAVDSGRFDNHPSVAAVLINIYYQMSASANNPAYTAMSRNAKEHLYRLPDGTVETRKGGDPNLPGDPTIRSEKLNLVADHVHEYFPDAEVLTGASGHVKNAYGIHLYHTWGAPFAELAAFFERYSKERAVTVYCGEYAIPYHGSYAHLNLWGQIRNKPEFYYWLENAARILGPAAYREKTVTATFAWDGARNDLLAAGSGHDGFDQNLEYDFIADFYAKILAESVNRTVFFWRYDGLSGLAPFEYVSGRFLTAARSCPPAPRLDGDLTRPGVKPESLIGSHVLPLFDPFGPDLDFRPNLVSTPFRQAMKKTICKIVGAGRDYYEDDHAFWSGETLRKGFGVIHMGEKTLDGTVEIVLLDGSGAAAAKTELPLRLAPFTQKIVPFELKLPKTGVRREYTLHVRFLSDAPDAPELAAAQKIQLFPQVLPAVRKIALYGGKPEFVSALKQLGYVIVQVQSFERLDPALPLVVAPGAIRDRKNLPDFSVLADEQGVRTLVMEQHRNASPELMKIRSRQAFINAPSHPVLEGLADVDFSYWRGSHSLDPAYGIAEPGHVWSNASWTDWGNRNMVAANVFRRPQTGNFLSLLVSGFDLYQTPLLEYRGPNGCWIGSQLEIGERLLLDPVATTLFCRMVDYLAERRPVSGEVGFFGREKGKALLDKFGVRYRESDLGNLASLRLLILSDPDWKELEKRSLALSDYVYNGGKILYLHTGESWYGSWLPFPMELQRTAKVEKAVSLTPGSGNWMEGWSECELYWRGKPELPEFARFPKSADATSPAVLVRVNHGCGSYFFSSLTPESFDKGKMAAAKYARLISAVLTSHGAAMSNGASPYLPNRSLTIPLRNQHWEFSLDPNDEGLGENRQSGFDGSGRWLSGQQTLGGESVRPGVGYEAFLERDYAGVSFYRLRFKLTAEQAAAKNMRAELGNINSFDRTFLNGKEIGSSSTGRRVYRIPDGLLQPGENTLVIRVENRKKPGGLVDTEIQLTNADGVKSFWKRLYSGGNRDYDYNPDWIRQY